MGMPRRLAVAVVLAGLLIPLTAEAASADGSPSPVASVKTSAPPSDEPTSAAASSTSGSPSPTETSASPSSTPTEPQVHFAPADATGSLLGTALYGVDTTGKLYSIATSTGALTQVATFGVAVEGLAVTDDGSAAYAMTRTGTTRTLYKYSSAGVTTVRTVTGLGSSTIMDAGAMDPAGTYYYFAAVATSSTSSVVSVYRVAVASSTSTAPAVWMTWTYTANSSGTGSIDSTFDAAGGLVMALTNTLATFPDKLVRWTPDQVAAGGTQTPTTASDLAAVAGGTVSLYGLAAGPDGYLYGATNGKGLVQFDQTNTAATVVASKTLSLQMCDLGSANRPGFAGTSSRVNAIKAPASTASVRIAGPTVSAIAFIDPDPTRTTSGVLTLPGQAVTLTLPGASYADTWSCVAGSTTLGSGTGSSGTFTAPAIADGDGLSVACTVDVVLHQAAISVQTTIGAIPSWTVGAPVTVSYRIWSYGQAGLTWNYLVDRSSLIAECAPGSTIAAGAWWNCTHTFSLTASDVSAGTFSSSSTLSATSVETSTQVTATSTDTMTQSGAGPHVCGGNAIYGINNATRPLPSTLYQIIPSDSGSATVTSQGGFPDAVNGLAVAKDGRFAYAVQRDVEYTEDYKRQTAFVYRFGSSGPVAQLSVVYQKVVGKYVNGAWLDAMTDGGFDPTTGGLWLGGTGAVAGATTATTARRYFQISLNGTPAQPGLPSLTYTVSTAGSGSDLAFDHRGRMYIADSDTSTTHENQVAYFTPSQVAAGGVQTPSRLVSLATVSGSNTTTFPGAAFGSSGRLYVNADTSLYGVNPSTGAQVSLSTMTASMVDLGSCAIPSAVAAVQVDVVARHADSDQFTITLTGGSLDEGGLSATTTGSDTGVQADEIPLMLVQPGETYTLTEAAAGSTDFDNYLVSWSCTDEIGGGVVASGTGVSGSFVMSAETSIGCVFTNDAIRPKLTVAKSSGTAGPYVDGQMVSWLYRVTNAGNVPVDGITVDDDRGVPVSCPKTLLAVGESMVCSGSGPLVQG